MAAATTTQVVMPQMGDSVTEGTILEWRKSEGDRVNADETLVEISTDKVDAEVPAPISGTVVKIHAPEGQTVAVGAVLGEMSSWGGPKQAAAPAAVAPAQANGASAPPANGAKASPVARRAAETLSVDLGSVAGSGPAGRIVKADVLAAAEQPGSDGGPPSGATELRGGGGM